MQSGTGKQIVGPVKREMQPEPLAKAILAIEAGASPHAKMSSWCRYDPVREEVAVDTRKNCVALPGCEPQCAVRMRRHDKQVVAGTRKRQVGGM